ncbi:MAG: SAM-dependent DNA methyltransferase [Holophagae bacterium]|nr:SAM-dependent DNA methyltransferase [Holophagae bacterium]
MSDIGQKLWGFCNTLRHDGIDYGDYIEQITYLLFLKMADERSVELPKGCSWPTLRDTSGTELLDRYTDLLRTLGRQPGILGDIYAGAQSRFANPVNLKKLLGLIDETDWSALNIDVKATAFEDLLERAANEGKKGAGQYFTPRLLIQSIVRCLKPDPCAHADFTVCDPACGSGGFLVCAYEWLMTQTQGGALDRDTARRVKERTYVGQDLVARPRRLALMNLYLHGIHPDIRLGDSIYEAFDGRRHDVVLTNPPFGTKGANQAPDRDDFTIATSNKQLNFLQHVMQILKPGGRAAVVVPDNCLFADQAGEVFAILTQDCDLHTVLRLPNGTFTPYSPGTKTNVVFFTKGVSTERVWIYDARTNVPHITKKDRPLSAQHFADFERCFGPDPHGRARRAPEDAPDGRWRPFHISEVRERHFKIDALKWLKDETLDDGTDLPEPDELVTDAIAELQAAIEELQQVLVLLENGAEVGSAEPPQPAAAPHAPQATDVGAGLAPAQEAAGPAGRAPRDGSAPA